MDFSAHPVMAIIFFVSIAVWLFFEYRQGQVKRTDGAEEHDDNSLGVLKICIALGAITAPILSSQTDLSIASNQTTFTLWLIIFWAGLVLRVWSFRALGKYFTFHVTTSEDQTVINTGPYRYLRHPSYTGTELLLLSLGFIYNNWAGLLAITVLPMIGLYYRIRVEEKALATSLGDRYISFAQDRKRMIPFIW